MRWPVGPRTRAHVVDAAAAEDVLARKDEAVVPPDAVVADGADRRRACWHL